ncbi:hypothetical protein ACXJY6_00015 [Vibrio sp. RC27]
MTEQIICCELSEWNGTEYPDFELNLSNQFGVTCLPLYINNKNSSENFDSIWKYLTSNRNLIHEYINRQHEFRRSILFQQYENGEQLDLGYYDYIDLLSHLEERVVLCIRALHSFHPNLLPWLDYIVNKTNIKILILNSKGIKGLDQLNHFPRAILPSYSKKEIVEACSRAVYDLTGTSMSYSELSSAFSKCHSLKEFITKVQTAAVYQSTPSKMKHLNYFKEAL